MTQVSGQAKVIIAGEDKGAIAVMQRAHAQATALNRGIAGAGSSAAGAAMNFGKLRGSLTSVAQSILQLNPGVSSFVSILGSLALGGGVMVGVLAGVTALSFAWKALTADTKAAKEAAEEYARTMQGLRNAAGGPAVGLGAPMAHALNRTAEIDAEIAKINASPLRAHHRNQARLTQLTAERAGLANDLTGMQGLHNTHRLGGTATLNTEGLLIAHRASQIQRGQAMRSDLALTLSMGGGVATFDPTRPTANLRSNLDPNRGLSMMSDSVMANLLRNQPSVARINLARIAGEAELGRGGFNTSGAINAGIAGLGSILGGGNVGQSLFSTAAGVAGSFAGPVGAIASGALGLLGGLFGGSKEREEEAYRAHLRALRDSQKQDMIVHLHFPAGAFYDTNNMEWQEALVETIENATGNRLGRTEVKVA